MEYIIAPYGGDFFNYAYWDNAFTTEELDKLQEIALQATGAPKVGNDGGQIDYNYRRCNISWLFYKDNEWLYSRLDSIISKLNYDIFRYDILGFKEGLQLSNYKSEDSGFYDWHSDIGSRFNRKLSLSLQLTDATEYEGGSLELSIDNNNIIIPKKRGYISVFPSFISHRVSPVTSGSRQSLVTWINGPNFK
jgi:PKHD-type hydroxylase